VDQIAVDEPPPGMLQDGESDNPRDRNVEQQSEQSNNNNNNNNNNHRSNHNNDTNNMEVPTDEHGYDKLNSKRSDSSRFVFINMNGIPKSSNNILNRSLLQAINESGADVIGIAEHNCNFSKLPPQDQWHERVQEWWESSKSSISSNKHDHSESHYLPGGTITVAINKTSHRVQPQSSPNDPSGMGRWSSILFRGSQGIQLRVITAYRVCKQQNPGPNTSASQQHRYMLLQGDERHAREAIFDDLSVAIRQFHAAGEQVILMMDCNEDVRSPYIKRIMHEMGLREGITENREQEAQATQHTNAHHIPIDGIFLSASLLVQRGGYLAFGYFDSDHRAIWIDVTNANLFGFRIRDVPRHMARRLKCELPRVRERFQYDYKQLLHNDNLFQRIYHLQTLATYSPWTEAMSHEFNDIMTCREKAILLADSRCRKLCMGHVPFSDKFDVAVRTIALWKGVVKRKQGKKFSNTKIRSLARQLGIASPNDCTLEEAIRKKDLAFQEYYRNIKPHSERHRTTFFEQKALQISEDTDQEYGTVLKQMREREKLRKSNRRIDWTLEKHKGSGITKLSVEDAQGRIRDITTQREIEAACMKEFEAKYRQTENTPAMREPWLSILGYNGKTQGSEAILDGTLVFPEGTSQYTKDFIKELRAEPVINKPAAPAMMETSSYQAGWKKMKEKTSAGISGIHFGHMKACSTDVELSNFEATIGHIPYSTGFVPDAWKKGVCCMLPKKANSDKVTDLRTIVLQECEYNFNNKKLGREAMQHAENNDFIAPEQYGSRKGKRSIDHVLNKRLTYDLIRFSRRPGALCSNDAKSCYDRVLHSIVSIAFRRLGFPEQPIDCMIQCIQQMKYYIRTTFGTSTSSFSSQHTAIPIQGLLQGNGAGPTIWVIVSTPLLNMLRSADKGAHLLSAISHEPAHFVGFAFVDDTDLVTFRADDFTITDDEIFEDMQESIDRWEEGLKLTGGAIVPAKSWVYPISFKFSDDGLWKYNTMEANDFQFSVKNHEGIRQVLQQFEVDVGKETLGAILAPDGNNKAAVHKLRSIADTWASLISTGHLRPDDTFMATNSRVMKSLTYCLPAMTFTKKECDFILAPVLMSSLPSSHISRTFPRAVVFGPIAEMGLGYHTDLYTTQGVSQLHSILHYLSVEQDITGQLLRSNMEAARVDVGLGGNFFMYDYTTFSKHLTTSWVKSVWSFIDIHPISFSESITGDHQLKREQDEFIMFKIIQLSKYGTKDLCRINACRLYLQAYAFSDLTTGDGYRFTQEAWNCDRSPLRRTTLVWPYQPRPNDKARGKWRQAIKLAFPRTSDSTFVTPVGRWTDLLSRDIWTWFFHVPSSSVYKRFGPDWRKYKRHTQRGRLGQFPRLVYECNALQLPPNSMRATVEEKHDNLYLTGWASELHEVDHTQNQNLLVKYQQSINRSVVDMSTDYQYINCNEATVIQQIQSGVISVVSDGSYLKDEATSTAAWIIAISRNRYKIGRHVVTGNAIDQCSHRGELSGILGGITDINTLCRQYNITEGNAKLFCDGLGAVSMVSYIGHKLSPSHAHYDIIHALFRTIRDSPLNWTFHHVYGHQDESIELQDLSDEAFYNTLADEHAKHKLTETLSIPGPIIRPSILPYRLCTIHYRCNDGSYMSLDSKFSNTLTTLINTDRIQKYWFKKGVYPDLIQHSFDRTIAGRAMQSMERYKRRWISKWCVGICGTGTNLQLWRQQDHSNCPRCLQPNETAIHCITCAQLSATDLWYSHIQELHQWMLDSKGQPELVEVICSSLSCWRNNIPYPYFTNNPMGKLQAAIIDQHRLGWHRILYGIWSTQWIPIQQQHLLAIGSKKSAFLWMTKIQKRIWEVMYALWEHRNQVLHEIHHSVHPHELTAINGEIIQEMILGPAHLPASERYLFHVPTTSKLNWTIAMKIQWLVSVRRSRNHYYLISDTPLPLRHQAVTGVLTRWSKRNNVRL
jgi:hypothetical protein